MNEQAPRKQRTGEVTSASAPKTIVVKVVRRAPHPRYGKMVKQGKNYHAHDEQRTARTGDVVRIEECRPLSRLKRWRLVEIVKKATLETGGAAPPAGA